MNTSQQQTCNNAVGSRVAAAELNVHMEQFLWAASAVFPGQATWRSCLLAQKGEDCCSQEKGEGSITHHRAEWLGENVAFGKLCWAGSPIHTPVSFVPVTAQLQSSRRASSGFPKQPVTVRDTWQCCESHLPPITECFSLLSCELKVACSCSDVTGIGAFDHLLHVLKFTRVLPWDWWMMRIVVGLSVPSHSIKLHQAEFKQILLNWCLTSILLPLFETWIRDCIHKNMPVFPTILVALVKEILLFPTETTWS